MQVEHVPSLQLGRGCRIQHRGRPLQQYSSRREE
jgi:hypothetical protein